MFNRRFLAVSAASAALAASGVFWSATVANAAVSPPMVGPMRPGPVPAPGPVSGPGPAPAPVSDPAPAPGQIQHGPVPARPQPYGGGHVPVYGNGGCYVVIGQMVACPLRDDGSGDGGPTGGGPTDGDGGVQR